MSVMILYGGGGGDANLFREMLYKILHGITL